NDPAGQFPRPPSTYRDYVCKYCISLAGHTWLQHTGILALVGRDQKPGPRGSRHGPTGFADAGRIAARRRPAARHLARTRTVPGLGTGPVSCPMAGHGDLLGAKPVYAH